ncbi:MAG TPA: FkbM family methyltransferase [Solirubrobacterales bacterium]
MAGSDDRNHSRRRDLRIVLRDLRGPAERARLLARLLGSRLGLGRGPIRLRFQNFEAVFELSQGEISPYAQVAMDVDAGVIPDRSKAKGWTVMDCGANVGLFSLFLMDAERIVAVEPNPEVCGRLRRNMEINGIDATVIESAVSDLDGIVKMDFGGPSVLSGIGETGSDVRSASIDALLEETGIDSVDLLKLDVEGHEIEALTGGGAALRAGRIRRIVAEFGSPEELAALDAHLLPLGFERAATGSINARFDLQSG